MKKMLILNSANLKAKKKRSQTIAKRAELAVYRWSEHLLRYLAIMQRNC
jgi:hypothetical protein